MSLRRYRSARGTRGLLAAATAALLVLVGCSPDDAGEADQTGESGASGTAGSSGTAAPESSALVPSTTPPEQSVVLDEEAPGALAAAASRTFFDAAPVAVVVAPGEELRGASVAVALGAPVLLDGEGTDEELQRLGAEVVLAIGDIGDPGLPVLRLSDDAELARAIGADPESAAVAAGEELSAVAGLDPDAPRLLVPEQSDRQPDDSGGTSTETAQPGATSTDTAQPGATSTETAQPGATATVEELPELERAPALTEIAVLTTGAPREALALATAMAAGATPVLVPEGDPRASTETVQAVMAADPAVVVGLGQAFGDGETLHWRTATAATGVELPGGGQLVLPGKTYVALYGNPVTSALGVLGEQGPEATIARAAEHAEPYRALTDDLVVPALEIIATVASEGAGADGNYSNEIAIEELRPLVDLAREHGQYVVLDLQPGRTDFVTQAQLYEELLREPHVGLALDPEWRLGPDEVHLRQIGHVDVSEVDEVVDWLADLTREHRLPQKLLVLHQFQVRMVPGVNQVDQSRSEVAVLVHADGQGPQGSKQDTWRALHANAPDLRYWGWKNFYDEDSPVLTPEQTMLVEPTPDFVSYQ